MNFIYVHNIILNIYNLIPYITKYKYVEWYLINNKSNHDKHFIIY